MVFNYTLDSDRLSVDEVASFFDQVQPEELINELGYQKRDGTLLGIKDFFRAHYEGCKCRYTKDKKDIASIKFHLIFSDNILDLKKIISFRKSKGILEDLQNFDLYQDEVKANYSHKGDGTNRNDARIAFNSTNSRNLLDGSLMGTSSASAMATLRDETNRAIGSKDLLTKSSNKVLDYLDPNTRDIQQNINMYTGSDTIEQTSSNNVTGSFVNNSSGNSFSAASNPFQDRVTFLNLKIPSLISQYLEHYRILFHGY